jgi:uncharacterized protein YjbJ (UPF0337 family)
MRRSGRRTNFELQTNVKCVAREITGKRDNQKPKEGEIMNKDRVEGKLKDVGGRVERQVGEWTGDEEKQAHGAMKQAEGKVQNAWGKVKDAAQDTADNLSKKTTSDEPVEVEEKKEVHTTTTRKAS